MRNNEKWEINKFQDGKHVTGTGIPLTTTLASSTPVPVKITIWLEGWDKVGDTFTINDSNALASFDIAMVFQCDTL